MKLAVILLLVSMLQVTASVYSQNSKLSVKVRNQSIVDVLKSIEEQSDFHFFYKNEQIDVDRKVSITVENKTVEEILETIFEDTGIEYRFFGDKLILLSTNDARFNGGTRVLQQKGKISGKVVDEEGLPLPGVTVLVKGTTQGTVTNMDGNYSISNVSAGEILHFSFVGMRTQELVIGRQNRINVTMEPDAIGLEEVVAIGYGTKSKRKVLNSISKVDAEKLENASYSNMGQALAGVSPGVILKQSGGGPGNDVPSISIRGGGEPLYVIDGVVSFKNDYANLSPNDVQDISILKDAGASAIYGSRAANGVVLVTTKEAKGNSISYSNLFSTSTPALKPDFLSSYDYASFNNEIAGMYGITKPWNDEALQKFKDGTDPNYPSTNWWDEVFKPAPSQRHNLSVSGKEESIDYLFSLSFQEQGSAYKSSDAHNLKKYNFLSKVGKSYDKLGLKFDFTVRSTFTDYKDVPFSYWFIFGHVNNTLPYQKPYDEQGRYLAINSTNNPAYETDPANGYNNSWNRYFNGISTVTWDVPWVKGMQLGFMTNYNLNFSKSKQWRTLQPVYSNAGDKNEQSAPTLSESRATSRNYTLQSFIKYERTFGDHNLDLSLFYEESEGYYSNLSASRRDYVSDAIDYLFAGPQDGLTNSGSGDEYARRGYIGRLGYDYKDKYLLSASFRYDGSERFREDDRWGFFPSIGLGWRISEESFYKNLISESIINNMKLRASYGETGNDAVARFAFLSTFQPVEKRYFWGGSWIGGYSDNGLPAGNITWYTQKSYNVGLETDFFNNRLKTVFDGFYYRTNGYLANPEDVYTTPLGTSLPKINYGSTRRGGYEINLNWNDKIGDLEYSLGFNLTHYESFWELKPDESESSLKNPRTRETYESNYTGTGYSSLGYYNTNQDILNSPRRLGSVDLLPGDLKYKDLNGDGQINGDDFGRIGNGGSPDYYYGINLGASYRGFYMSAVIQGASNFDMWLDGRYSYDDGGADLLTVKPQTDVWTSGNPNARFPRINPTGKRENNVGPTSDAWLLTLSYVRLKNIELGYNFKMPQLQKVGINDLRVFVNGTNLLTYAPKVDGIFDPEASDGFGYGYPVEKVMSIGLNVKF
ncbi:TonB-dependent receptor [uncultured Sunxiuqinia sp.]|uniref:TonB-dependent receptor n=1 Tax=Sunxiuqinia rutila TaxID=1397841 RepID=UPI00262A78FB|nr:TonB-dependent receptor [uncultured Sunxiuqinia sp.]